MGLVRFNEKKAMISTFKNLFESRFSGIIILFSFLITQFLFFIDEGYYDFRWMKSVGNWLVFFIYFLIIAAFQLVVFLILQKYKPSKAVLISVIFGTVAALFLLFKIFA